MTVTMKATLHRTIAIDEIQSSSIIATKQKHTYQINCTPGCFLILFSVCTDGVLAFLIFTFFLNFLFLTNCWFHFLSMHYCWFCCRSWWKPGVLVMPSSILYHLFRQATHCNLSPFNNVLSCRR